MASISLSTEPFVRRNSQAPFLRPTSVSPRYSFFFPRHRRSLPLNSFLNPSCLLLHHDFYLSSFPSYRRESKSVLLFLSKWSESEPYSSAKAGPAAEAGDDEWLSCLPEKNKPLYSHSLPCIEAWLRSLGFLQSKEDRAVWFVQKPDWHAQLSLDVTDLYIRYLKSGPGNLEKDVERRFSYALSREDIENAVLGGP